MSTTALTLSSPSWRLGTRLTNAFNACFLLNLFDDAFADLLCLQTYTHGTSPKCYNGIMQRGADPSHGGKGGENGLYNALGLDHQRPEDKDTSMDCKGRFFVFLHECPTFTKRVAPRVYSAATCLGENCTPNQNIFSKILFIFLSIFESFCSPTLKFRFRQDTLVKIDPDETFNYDGHYAGSTRMPIAPEHIGLHGSLSQGINRQWGSRISRHPCQFALGLFKLAVAVALVALIVYTATHYDTGAQVLLIYAAIKGTQIAGRFFLPLFHNLFAYA